MTQNAMYICIFWCTKICWFQLKKWWYQHNSRCVSRDLYIFGIFVRSGITFPSFVIARYVWQILGRIVFLVPPHTWRAPKSPSWIVLKKKCLPVTVSFVQIRRIYLISNNCTCNLVWNFVSILESLFICYHYIQSIYMSLLNFSYIFLQSHEDIEMNRG